MNPIGLVLLIAAAALASGDSSSSSADDEEKKRKERNLALGIPNIIRKIADQQGVPRQVALAWADAESGLNPNLEDNLDWPTADGGARYKSLVVDNPRLFDNPARTDPSAWHSYGLYRLPAAFYSAGNQHPKELLDPTWNATLALGNIAKLYRTYHGSWDAARLAFVCGSPTGCPPAQAQQILAMTHEYLKKWEGG